MLSFKSPSKLIACTLLCLICTASLALGQEEDPVRSDRDLADIRRSAEEIGRDYLKDRPTEMDAAIDVDAILADAERFSADARAMQDNLMAKLQAIEPGNNGQDFFDEHGRIDASTLAAAAGDVARASRREESGAPLFISFVSLSMPEASLTSIIEDTNKAGGLVVVRGFYGGSYGAFANRVRELFEEGDEVGISIDPRYFQALNVSHVPTYAVTLETPSCDAFVCGTIEADTVSGNISVAAALELLAENGETAPAHARAALSEIEDKL